ncbi:OmpW family outer membrane protein [Bradyrhizobium sp.]|uniref:OmpW/AlkL family protein n=1 Tax=Bradyrhizobium sp. TaxID=376 RepID=UPI001D4E2A98|nr:OmpW family outer membrane protein [Bradyrhizobium sp.]MBI5318587.1 OmpW family protein [Bradyrhizobium sp.]
MKKYISNALSLPILAAALFGAVQSAQAADLPVYKKAPPVEAWNPWMIRLRVLGVLPDTGGSTVNVGNPLIPALSSPNSGLSMNNQVVPELDITYFFTKNIAAELILGVTRHSITGNGSLTPLPIGKSWLLPPTLTLQYHFTGLGAFKPYVGAGVNYTVFFSQSAANAPTFVPGAAGVLATTNLNVSNAFGAAVQFGFDYMLDRHWGLNVDVKKLWLRPDYTAVVNGGIPVSGRANIDPWLVGGGLTYKF